MLGGDFFVGASIASGRLGIRPEELDRLTDLLRANPLDVFDLGGIPLVVVVPDPSDHLLGAGHVSGYSRGCYATFTEQSLAKRLRGQHCVGFRHDSFVITTSCLRDPILSPLASFVKVPVQTSQTQEGKELPSVGFFDRLEAAISYWLQRQGRRQSAGLKATELLGLLRETFPNDAPKFPSGVNHWLKENPSLPSIDNGYMLAVSLGVRPEWLVLNIGEMADESHGYDERPYQRPPGQSPEEKSQKPRRAS